MAKAKTEIAERLMSRVEKVPDGCWLWRGAIAPSGYGVIWNGEKRGVMTLVHRVSYKHFVGPISDGMQIDHLCRVRHCVNPEHLEPVTQRENILRGTSVTAENARKTHCQNGHPLIGDNLLMIKGARRCRTCWNAYSNAYKRRWREARRAAGQPVS